MIDYLKYRLELMKLRRQESRTHRFYQKKLSSLRKSEGSREQIEALEQEDAFEYSTIAENIDILVTSFLRGQTNKHFIPFPDYSDQEMWKKCQWSANRNVLTELGITTVRSALRKEHKELVELFFKISVAITGIIGALTGLFAVILS